AVDLITHSTGGLVAKSYLQSEAYANRDVQAFMDANPNAVLPEIATLIQVGVPNQGAGSILNLLENNFNQKQATRVLQLSLKKAYELFLESPASILDPDGSPITNFDGSPIVNERQFIAAYVGTLQNLLAAYPFIDDGEVAGVTLTADARSVLLLDLNSNGVDSFVSGAAATHIVYGSGETTLDRATSYVGLEPSALLGNEILGIRDFLIGSLPGDNDTWYDLENADYQGIQGGDGTVSEFSAAFGIAATGTVTLNERPDVEHTGLVNDPESQQVIIQRLLGLDTVDEVPLALITDVPTPGTLASALKLIEYGILPVEPIEIGGLTINLTPEGIASFLALYDTEDNAIKFSTTAVIHLGEFLIVQGTVGFELDLDTLSIDVSTQLPGNLTSLFGGFGSTIPDVPMRLTTITGEDVSAFVGLNGWQDVDEDGKISWVLPDGTTIGDGDDDGVVDSVDYQNSGVLYGDVNRNGLVEFDESFEYQSENRIGIEIQDLDIAVAMLKVRVSLADRIANPALRLYQLIPKLTAVAARADSAGLIGLEGLVSISLKNIEVEVNTGGRWRPTVPFRPVADFLSNFPSELASFAGTNGILEVSDAADGTLLRQALNLADVNQDGIVTYQELVDEFDQDADGFVSTTELPLLADGDVNGNNDGIIDDAGLRIPLADGTDALTIAYGPNELYAASAGQAEVQVNQFVQVVGGLSIVKGPRELVDVATNVPKNVGDLFALVVDGLTSLGSAVLDALGNAEIPADLILNDPAFPTIVWDAVKAYYLDLTGRELEVDLAALPTPEEVSAEIRAVIEEFRDYRSRQLYVSSDLSTIHNLEVETLQVGMSNAVAFAGIGGPFWTDLDGNAAVNWVLDTGDGDAASRTLDAGSAAVVVELVTYNPGDVLPADKVVTLG
ncbi:MAG: hypothetical protein OEW35_21910, partial [Gammaproteobacteria bacterium]|nr:hypothetical protein [Gammaproteobacteria bacterium]